MMRPCTHRALLALLIAAWAPAAAPALGADPAGDLSAPAPAVLPAPPAAAPAPAPGPAQAPAFEGLTWSLVAYRSGDTLTEAAKGGMPARLRFEEGRVVGSAGCNRLMGTYTTQGETIRFEPRMASTMMACPEPLMTQERETGAALAAAAAFRLDGKLLELQDKEGKPLLRLIVEEPSPLTDRTWRLAGYNNGRQAIVSALAGTEITLELRDDGTLGGSNGCNRYMSGYTLEGERLTIGPLATTRMACKGPKGAEQQAADYAAALETVAGFRIEADTLTLTKGDGTPAARFQVQAPPPPQSPVVESPAIEPPAVEAGAEGGTGTTPAAR